MEFSEFLIKTSHLDCMRKFPWIKLNIKKESNSELNNLNSRVVKKRTSMTVEVQESNNPNTHFLQVNFPIYFTMFGIRTIKNC